MHNDTPNGQACMLQVVQQLTCGVWFFLHPMARAVFLNCWHGRMDASEQLKQDVRDGRIDLDRLIDAHLLFEIGLDRGVIDLAIRRGHHEESKEEAKAKEHLVGRNRGSAEGVAQEAENDNDAGERGGEDQDRRGDAEHREHRKDLQARTDIAGALALGMTAIRFTGFHDRADGEGPEAPIVLSRFQDIPAALSILPRLHKVCLSHVVP